MILYIYTIIIQDHYCPSVSKDNPSEQVNRTGKLGFKGIFTTNHLVARNSSSHSFQDVSSTQETNQLKRLQRRCSQLNKVQNSNHWNSVITNSLEFPDACWSTVHGINSCCKVHLCFHSKFYSRSICYIQVGLMLSSFLHLIKSPEPLKQRLLNRTGLRLLFRLK